MVAGKGGGLLKRAKEAKNGQRGKERQQNPFLAINFDDGLLRSASGPHSAEQCFLPLIIEFMWKWRRLADNRRMEENWGGMASSLGQGINFPSLLLFYIFADNFDRIWGQGMGGN
jgi:hypothetical protein